MAKAINPFSMVPPPEKRDRFAPFASYRAEIADIARFKMRQAKSDHVAYSPQSERVVELLSDWASSFVSAA